MRERTTWNRDNIKAAAGTDASGKSAAMNRQADPYAMNQDHLGQQPKADKYLTGDPSTFAEDITEPNTWDREYEGGATKRDEIGLPDFRPETFNHAEKTAGMDEKTLIKKADLCALVARHMLKGRKFATEAAAVEAVEAQSVALMYMPNADLIQTASRIATEDGGQFPQGGSQQQQQAVQEEQAVPPAPPAQQQQQQAVKQCIQSLQNGDMAGVQAGIQAMVTAALKSRKAADEQQQQQQQQQQAVQQDQQQVQQGQQQQAVQEGQQQQVQQQEQQALEQMLSQAIQSADYDAKPGPAINPPGYGGYTGPQTPKMARGRQGADQEQQQVQQQDQQQQSQQVQQQVAPQGQGQQQQQAVQQAPVQAPPAQQQQADDMLLDDMLGPDQGQGMNEMDIEMESPTMDTGEIVLSASDDEVLKTLFATQESEDAEQAQQQGQQKQAGMSRTASANPSTRTIGTRPTVGVSKVGGAQAPRTGSDVNSLSNLWASAPDVREAFNIR